MLGTLSLILLKLQKTRYVLPDQMLLRIVQVLPENIPKLIACCSPVPPLLRVHSTDVLDILKAAREESESIKALEQV